jgi:hypothetical protein
VRRSDMFDDETKKMIALIFVVVACLLLILFAVRIDASDDIWKEHPVFSSTDEYVRYTEIIRYHGDVMVSTDFSHFIRLNGERCELRTD